MPLASATSRVHAPAGSMTIGASIVPFAVVTPVTLPALIFTASAFVGGPGESDVDLFFGERIGLGVQLLEQTPKTR